MAIPCFYYADLSHEASNMTLSPQESSHALQSRRLGVGSKVMLIDGRGARAEATVTDASRRAVTVDLLNGVEQAPPPMPVSIAVAMPKGDRQKVLIDMLTQLGVVTIIPIISEYTVSAPTAKQLEKLKKIAIEACKQSHNPWVPNILAPIGLSQLMQSEDVVWYADQRGKSISSLAEKKCSKITLLIGPEGGFSEAEITTLKDRDAKPYSLSEHILRTETAAVASASAVINLAF